MKLANDEVLIRKGAATHLVPFEGVGGKLFLTNQRLFFEAHSLNIQKRDGSIRLENIVTVEAKHSDLISRKLSIYLRNKSVEEFIVYKRKIWVAEIEKAIKNLKPGKKVYLGMNQKTEDFSPLEGQHFFANILIRAIIIGIFVGVLMYLLL
jgi:hypothetical protein